MKVFNFNEFSLIYEERLSVSDPIGIAVLGVPAGGKSHTMNDLKDIVDDSRIIRALDNGVILTVDKLRDEFQSKSPAVQLLGFLKSFYLMRDKANTEPDEYLKWFNQIKALWINKLANKLPDLKITADDKEIYFDGKSSIENLKMLKTIDPKPAIDSLDNYEDYKRVVRYFQNVKQDSAIKKSIDVTYDEAGDEPTKIVNNIDKLHKKGYVTDVFLIHPDNVATNLIQNFKRVVLGDDGGRDSSAAIVQAYKDIEANKDVYTKNAEKVVTIKSKDIDKIKDELKVANVEDDKSRGNKPIDVLAEIRPMIPTKAYETFTAKMNTEQKTVFDAMLRYIAYYLKDIPTRAKNSLLNLTKDMSNKKALDVLKAAAKSGKYNFKFGGVTDELVKKAQDVLS
jgi:hypothetical protein